MYKIIVAIDGYSSCGKSTLAKALACKSGYRYIDSGAMYRAVTLYCLNNNIIQNQSFKEEDVVNALDRIQLEFHLNKATQSSEMYLNNVNVENEIREMQVANFVSPISAIKGVRDKIVGLQRSFGKNKGIVMDGRDISTNVFPDAELKIFMTANEEVRAKRRWKELSEKGLKVSFEEIKANLNQRDHEDTHRKYNPLKQAIDAVVLDNSYMTEDEQLHFVLDLVKEKVD